MSLLTSLVKNAALNLRGPPADIISIACGLERDTRIPESDGAKLSGQTGRQLPESLSLCAGLESALCGNGEWEWGRESIAEARIRERSAVAVGLAILMNLRHWLQSRDRERK
jgi:hypothetical protein